MRAKSVIVWKGDKGGQVCVCICVLMRERVGGIDGLNESGVGGLGREQ